MVLGVWFIRKDSRSIWCALISLLAVTTVASGSGQNGLRSLIDDDVTNALKCGECRNLVISQRTVGGSLYSDVVTVCKKFGRITAKAFLTVMPHQITPITASFNEWPFCDNCFPEPRPSPVDIVTSLVVDVTLPKLRLTGSFNQDVDYQIKNTGQIVRSYMLSDNKPYISGGPLHDTYIFEQFHGHWGHTDDCSSEHTVDGECFSIEGHVVFFNSKYGNFEVAKDKPDGICVFAFFAKAVDEPNPLLDPLIEVLPEVSKPGQEITVQGKPIFDWFDGLQCHNRFYYTYPGSQTISPFAESVIYIIFPEPLTLSHEQLATFRDLQLLNEKGEPTNHNNRPLQPLHHRHILRVDNIANYNNC